MKCSLGKKKLFIILHLILAASFQPYSHWSSRLPPTHPRLSRDWRFLGAAVHFLWHHLSRPIPSWTPGFLLLLTLTKTLILTLRAILGTLNPWSPRCKGCFGNLSLLSAALLQLGLSYSETKQKFDIKVRSEKRERPELQLELGRVGKRLLKDTMPEC